MTDDTHAHFTLNPGTATGSLTITEGPTGATQSYAIVGPGSLRFLGNITTSTGSNTLFANQSQASFSCFIKFNQPFGSPESANAVLLYNAGLGIIFGNSSNAVTYIFADYAGSNTIGHGQTFTTGLAYHVALSWNAGTSTQSLYINGTLVASGTDSTNTRSSVTALELGWAGTAGGLVDYEIANMAIWDGYALTKADVLNLRDGTATPLNLVGSVTMANQPATSWWPLGGVPGTRRPRRRRP